MFLHSGLPVRPQRMPFDRFHKDINQLCRPETPDQFQSKKTKPQNGFFSFLMNDAESTNTIQTPPVLGDELKKNFPEIEHALRIQAT
jgi:hypothetical protein